MNQEFLTNIMQRHVQDCAELTAEALKPLILKYELDREAQADLLRAVTVLVCDVVQQTAELYKEVIP